MLPTPPARPSRSGTVPAASCVPGAGAPDRLTVNLYAATLKRGVGPADHRSVHPFQRLLLPSAALAALAILFAALLPGRAAADFNGPKATTAAATAVTDTTATLNGFVQTRGRDTVYFFQYGPTARYGAQTPKAALDRNQSGPVAATATGLVPSTLYHFRLVAFHPGRGLFETDFGADQTFTSAPAPVAPAPVTPSIPTPNAPATLPTTAPVATLGTSVVVAPVKGTVLVKVPGAAGFVPLGGANGTVPTGTILDTRKGQVALTTALDGGRTQTATFERGVFAGPPVEDRSRPDGHLPARARAGLRHKPRDRTRRGGHQAQAEEAPALGARQGRPLPHARQQQRRDRPRHLLDHDRHLHRDAHDREGGRRLGPRRAPASHRPRARRPQLSRAPALASGPWRDRCSASSIPSARGARTSPPSS